MSSSNEAGGGRTGFAATSRRPAESGRYEVEGYRLVLTGEDGSREGLSFFQPERDADKLLVIGGSNYLRRDGRR